MDGEYSQDIAAGFGKRLDPESSDVNTELPTEGAKLLDGASGCDTLETVEMGPRRKEQATEDRSGTPRLYLVPGFLILPLKAP